MLTPWGNDHSISAFLCASDGPLLHRCRRVEVLATAAERVATVRLSLLPVAASDS